MARGRGRRRQGGMRRGTSRRRNQLVRRSSRSAPTRVIPSLPPTLDIQSNVITVWLRRAFGWGDPSNSFYTDFKASSILRYHISLATAYSQFRLLLVNIWFIPDSSANTQGVYAMSISDGYQNAGNAKTSFNDVLASAGSICRKVYQIGAVGWRPTEPRDLNWQQTRPDTASDQIFFSLDVNTNGLIASGTIDGSFVMDYHVQFRGHNSDETFAEHLHYWLPRAANVGLMSISYPPSVEMNNSSP